MRVQLKYIKMKRSLHSAIIEYFDVEIVLEINVLVLCISFIPDPVKVG